MTGNRQKCIGYTVSIGDTLPKCRDTHLVRWYQHVQSLTMTIFTSSVTETWKQLTLLSLYHSYHVHRMTKSIYVQTDNTCANLSCKYDQFVYCNLHIDYIFISISWEHCNVAHFKTTTSSLTTNPCHSVLHTQRSWENAMRKHCAKMFAKQKRCGLYFTALYCIASRIRAGSQTLVVPGYSWVSINRWQQKRLIL